MTFEELESIRERCDVEVSTAWRRVFKVYLIVISIIAILTLFLALLVCFILKDINMILLGIFFCSAIIVTIHLAIYFFFGGVLYVGLKTQKDTIAYKKAYKAHFVAEALAQTFTDLNYSHELGMPLTVLVDTGMINTGDCFKSNDYVSAKYKGIPFHQADILIQEENKDSDGSPYTTTVFCGRWITFSLNKRFERRLLIAGKRFRCYKAPKEEGFKKLELESSSFNKTFIIRAQDGFEAYYLLDPAFMERVERLNKLYKGRVMVCFSDNKIHIAINDRKDSFEPPDPKNPIDERVEFNKVYSDIKVITDLVDNLKLVK